MQSILNQAGLGRLGRGDRATSSVPVHCYQREYPGELIHVDIKKLARIPDGGGWRMHGRGNDTPAGHSGVDYAEGAAAFTGFIHFYNHHRSHGALEWATPIDTIRDNLPALHS